VQFIYNSVLSFVKCCLAIVSFFNKKINKGVIGRAETFHILEKHKSTKKTIWLHCASLGEYEQGLPVFETIRHHYKSHQIILSFFSPSGYEIRKKSPIADLVIYLPLDTKNNADRFTALLQPELSVFVKYDIWPNYIKALHAVGSKKILISALFRANQIYFKPYGGIFKKALLSFDYIFTQNETSKSLLENMSYFSVKVSGDTRFDRVTDQLQANNQLEFIEDFKNNKLLIVIGSSWEADEKLYLDFINDCSSDVKFLIAPHEINGDKINTFRNKITKSLVLYSDMKGQNLSTKDVFILDTIGLLSKAYTYADIAYVGGAAGSTGLHNILEPATFGVPILFGTNHDKFPEAQSLINFGGAFEIPSIEVLHQVLNELLKNTDKRRDTGIKSKQFIKNQTGATKIISEQLLLT
jgi:3-deoxy-D-manno-octulosonic-acid transferase